MSTNLEIVIDEIVPFFKKLNIEFIVVGATARDIIAKINNLPLSKRSTSDVDFGIMINSWSELEKLREEFRGNSKIKASSTDKNLVRYYVNEIPIDIVPFGDIENDGSITFPPTYESIMTVTGYKEALGTAITYSVGCHTIKVLSPEMFIALKILAWNDNRERKKDLIDIHYILENYPRIDPDTHEYLYDHHIDIIEHFEHDLSIATIALIGIRIKNFTTPEHIKLIGDILGDTKIKDSIVRDIVQELKPLIPDEKYAEIEKILSALRFGIST